MGSLCQTDTCLNNYTIGRLGFDAAVRKKVFVWDISPNETNLMINYTFYKNEVQVKVWGRVRHWFVLLLLFKKKGFAAPKAKGLVVRLTEEKNDRYNITNERTSLMFLSNISSAGLVVLGLFSNLFSMIMFDNTVFQRTSFRVYFKHLCGIHIASLFLTTLRQHTFLLDFEPRGKDTSRLFKNCAWVVWFLLVLDHCTNFVITLILWNRIWCQRNLDRTNSHEDAMRNPILLMASASFFSIVSSSAYTIGLLKDADGADSYWCSFPFLHKYGAPRLTHWFTKQLDGAEEIIVGVSLLLLLFEMLLRIIREKMGSVAKLRFSDLVGGYTDSEQSDVTSSKSGPIVEDIFAARSTSKMRITKSENLTTRRRNGSASLVRNVHPSGRYGPVMNLKHATFFEERDKSLSSLTVSYTIIYIFMGYPIKLLPFLMQTTVDDFPLMVMLSQLRQVYQAGTLLFLCLSSKLVRRTISEMAALMPSVTYTSSTHLFQPVRGLDQEEKTNMQPPPTSSSKITIAPGPLDRLEMGVTDLGNQASKSAMNVVSKHSSTTSFDTTHYSSYAL